ncbi:alpha/beta fold hydrolase [Hoyosella altamirensis]|uniref:Pimeloyl-ACP methyl ester carboxylesterase n=1 Tax=Hoyosella altamirensis TaxID=616997 RepID=A0A839RJB6_9ACTN|nr:alpha/beta hydrolase [Hoyosella altamirensis]MBB3036765.1 pimeloyl-ACP methyl ester carboxylesterase [Hoyosella altamirensis]
MTEDGDREVVLLHGLGGSPQIWEKVEDGLDRVSVPACAVALIGGVPISAEASHVAHVLRDAAIKPAIIVGHSMGGLVATALAEQAPELVERLVLISTSPTLASRSGARSLSERIIRLPVIGPLVWRLAPESQIRAGLQSIVAPGGTVPDFVVDDLQRAGPRGTTGSSKAIDTYLGEEPLASRLRALGIGTDVVFGLEDRRVDPRSLEVYRGMSNVTITTIGHAGHLPPWETPDAVVDVITERW